MKNVFLMDTKLRKLMEARCSTNLNLQISLSLLNTHLCQNFITILIYDNTRLLL